MELLQALWIILLHSTGFNGSQPVSDRVEYQRRHGLKAASGLDLDIDEIIGNHFRAFDAFYLCLLSNMQVLADPPQHHSWSAIRQPHHNEWFAIEDNGVLLGRNQRLRFLYLLVVQFIVLQNAPLSKGVA